MTTVNMHHAKTHLSGLVVRVEAGEDIVIARGGKPVARLAPYAPPARREPGAWQGRVHVPGSFFDPLPEEELQAWEGGA